MIKNSIDTAQILASICTEQYTSVYYTIVEKIYTCLKNNNTLFIYTSPARHGIALDFQTKLVKGQKNVKIWHSIAIIEFTDQFESQATPEDTLLFLDKKEEILEIAQKYNIFTIALTEHELGTDLDFIIPTLDSNRTSEIQYILLNSISEDCLKFLP